MTSLSMRGPSYWNTTAASGTPACGQTVSCTPTSVRRAQGTLGSLPLPQHSYSLQAEECRKCPVSLHDTNTRGGA